MNEKIGFSISGDGIFGILLAAAAFVVTQAATGNIEIVTVIVFIPPDFTVPT